MSKIDDLLRVYDSRFSYVATMDRNTGSLGPNVIKKNLLDRLAVYANRVLLFLTGKGWLNNDKVSSELLGMLKDVRGDQQLIFNSESSKIASLIYTMTIPKGNQKIQETADRFFSALYKINVLPSPPAKPLEEVKVAVTVAGAPSSASVKTPANPPGASNTSAHARLPFTENELEQAYKKFKDQIAHQFKEGKILKQTLEGLDSLQALKEDNTGQNIENNLRKLDLRSMEKSQKTIAQQYVIKHYTPLQLGSIPNVIEFPPFESKVSAPNQVSEMDKAIQVKCFSTLMLLDLLVDSLPVVGYLNCKRVVTIPKEVLREKYDSNTPVDLSGVLVEDFFSDPFLPQKKSTGLFAALSKDETLSEAVKRNEENKQLNLSH